MNPHPPDFPNDADPSRHASPPGPVLRLLDANANRAREGLRVLEDWARFVRNDAQLASTVKNLRHAVTAATMRLGDDLMLHRDTPGDVGTAIKTDSEAHRADTADVIRAAAKRVGEALRCLAEFAKTHDAALAAELESIRYRFYDVELTFVRMLRPPLHRIADVRLYVLITASCCRGDWLTAAEEAIRGGADCIQLREKDIDSRELLARAQAIVKICRRHDVPCIINDRPDIALLAGADGVHVGQTDLPAAEVRKLLGRDAIVGVSTHNLEQARQAVRDGADYIGVGPIFRSPTKPREFVAGPAFAREVAGQIDIPAVAIAGITMENVEQVLATGIKAVAVTAAVLGAADVRAAAAELKARMHAAGLPSGHPTVTNIAPK